jgi:hypothetical protein
MADFPDANFYKACVPRNWRQKIQTFLTVVIEMMFYSNSHISKIISHLLKLLKPEFNPTEEG